MYIYPRISEGNVPDIFLNHPNIKFIQAPIIELSATFIRQEIKEKRNVKPLLPEKVWQYIDQMGHYL
ncbi:putative nicotinate-nucleotide adenylyltransferase (fragment) [Capnocytophaga canimorsus]